jgi:four helix bundle protein
MAKYLFPFEKLDVWQLALDLVDTVLAMLEKLPQNKHIRLISQIEAASTSPAQNIAEGKGRQYKKEFIQFLYIARGSVFEVVTLNELFRKRNLFSEEEANEIRKRCEEIDRKLIGLINSLRGNKRPFVLAEREN